MNGQSQISQQLYNVLPTDIEGFDFLAELALDMRWSWNHATDAVWRELDRDLWALTNNPWVVLVTVSRDKIERLLADPVFRGKLENLVQTRRQVLKGCDPLRQEAARIRQFVGAIGGCLYRGSVPARRPATDYTARIIPHHDGVAVPLEAPRILWQR